MNAARPLSEIVDNRRWLRRLKPFPHFVVPNLFIPSVAEEIETAARKVIEGEAMGAMARYDASGWGFPPTSTGPFAFFVTKEWCDLVSRLSAWTRSPT